MSKKHKIKMLVSILLESPFYLTLSMRERYVLLVNLVEAYPDLFDGEGEL